MEDIIDLIATGDSQLDISDAIKNALFVKSAERLQELRPEIAKTLFDVEEE